MEIGTPLGGAAIICFDNLKSKHDADVHGKSAEIVLGISWWVAVISAKNHKRQRRKRQSVTAKGLNRNTNLT